MKMNETGRTGKKGDYIGLGMVLIACLSVVGEMINSGYKIKGGGSRGKGEKKVSFWFNGEPGPSGQNNRGNRPQGR